LHSSSYTIDSSEMVNYSFPPQPQPQPQPQSPLPPQPQSPLPPPPLLIRQTAEGNRQNGTHPCQSGTVHMHSTIPDEERVSTH